jgi:ubiquinone/menaquinone biosynthesis C-methylase UbiE
MKTNEYVKLISRLNQGNPTTGGLGNLRTAINSLPLSKMNKVLEIGCNTGSSTIALGEMLINSDITGIDIDADMIAMAEQNISQAVKDGINKKAQVNVEIADAKKLPYPNNTFDLVVSSGTLSFVDNRELAIQDIYRVLKPGGFLLTLDYFSKKSQPIELAKRVSSIIGVDVTKTTLKSWINLHSTQPFNIEGIETKKSFMHSMSIDVKMNNLKTVLKQQGHSCNEEDLETFESHLEIFKENEKYVGVINIVARKLEVLSLLSDAAN